MSISWFNDVETVSSQSVVRGESDAKRARSGPNERRLLTPAGLAAVFRGAQERGPRQGTGEGLARFYWLGPERDVRPTRDTPRSPFLSLDDTSNIFISES